MSIPEGPVSIILALASLLFAGLNDFVFKQYIHGRAHPLGLFVLGVGVVWTAVLGTAMAVSTGAFTGVGWPVALGAGLASVAANLLFIASFRVVSAGTGATIYRLNLVLVAILGVVLLGESLTPWKVIGVGLGGAAVILIRNSAPHEHLVRAGALCLLLACGLRAIVGILYKLSNTVGVPPFEMLTIGGLCWVGGGLVFSLYRRESLQPSWRVGGFALLSGLLVCGIVYFMLAATRQGEASIVVPITQLSFTITALLGVVFHGESLGPRKALALAAAVGCVLALTLA